MKGADAQVFRHNIMALERFIGVLLSTSNPRLF
jgi:hypothetical protein